MAPLFDRSLSVPYLIAEVGLAHGGSYTLASSYIKLCKELGINAVKFQHHSSIHESTYSESFRFSSPHIFPSTRYDYWDDTSFSKDQWTTLCAYAKSLDIAIGITPNSRHSLRQVYECGFDFIKIGSSDFTNYHMLDDLQLSHLPVVASLGFGQLESINYFLSRYSIQDLYFLDCISSYPSNVSDFSVNRLFYLKSILPDHIQVGLSDHSGSLMPILASVLSGFRIFEFHLTISPHIFNFDLTSSLTIEQVTTLQECIKQYLSFSTYEHTDNYINKSDINVLKGFKKYLFVSDHGLAEGTHISADNILVLRSACSPDLIPQDQYHSVLGKRTLRDLQPHTPLSFTDLLMP